MRVCDVVLNSIWYDPRVRKQIKEYKNNGIDICCVGLKCQRYDREQVEKIPCETKIVYYGDKYAGKLNSVFKKIYREMLIEKLICKAIVSFKPDVIHANDLNALIPAYRAAKKLRCKLIYDSHEIFIENYTSNKQKWIRLWLRMQEKYICKKVDKMICVSHAAAEYFKREYKIPLPDVITNCALKSEYVDCTEKNQGFEVLNHGQFYEGRGYDIMLEAAPLLSEHTDIKLAVRGFGRIEEQLHKRAEELQADNFIFYPRVKVEELISYAAKSHVGVAVTVPLCLNFELSVSNKLFEYTAAGLPVIMSDIPEHRYLNEKYHFGIIMKEPTPQAFAEAVLKLYTDKDLYEACAENARKLRDEVNWEKEFSELIKFIQK